MKLHCWHVVQPAFDMSARMYAEKGGLLFHTSVYQGCACCWILLLYFGLQQCLLEQLVHTSRRGSVERGGRCWGPDTPIFHNSERRCALEWAWSGCTGWMQLADEVSLDVLMKCIAQVALSKRSPVPVLHDAQCKLERRQWQQLRS